MKLPFIKTAFLFIALALTPACSFAPNLNFFPDAGRSDSGVQPMADSGTRVDAGLPPNEACDVLNGRRCDYLARCGLIGADVMALRQCERLFQATWCGPMTWPSHVAAGALKYEPARAEDCAAAFATQACEAFETLPDSCTRFLVPRVPLGEDCYDGFVECTDGVCRGSSCPRTCQTRALLDDPCSADGECRSGLYCKLSPFMPTVGQCASFGANGTACENDRQCLEGLQCLGQKCRVLPAPDEPCVEGQCSELGFCDAAAADGGVCRVLPLPGTPCVEGRCAEGAFCEGGVDAGVCLVRKLEGATCAEGECVDSLVCDPVRAVCAKVRLSSGELCSLAQECPSGEVCLGASSSSSGNCHAPHGEGESCQTHLDCEGHLACQPVDGGFACQRRAEGGTRCQSSDVCQAGAVCSGAMCTDLPLPGESCAQTRACRWGLCRDLVNTDGGAVCGALLSAAQACTRGEECASGACVGNACVARCVP